MSRKQPSRKGSDTETIEGAANSYRSPKKPGRPQRKKPKNEKHEIEVEIEKVVKAQKEAQSVAEVADREEQSAHHKESRATSSRRRTRGNTSRKWKLNELQKICDGILALMDKHLSHRPERLQEPKAISKGRSRGHPVCASRPRTGRREATESIASQERREFCEAEWCVQEHTAQPKVAAVKNNRNSRKRPRRTKQEP